MRSLVIFTLINITLHYHFSYIGLAHMTSSCSVITDTMGSGDSVALNSSVALWIMAILVFTSSFSFSIYNQLLSFNPISKIAIFSSFMPIAGVMISGWLLGEPFVTRYYLAAVIVACGIYIINRSK